MEENHIVWFLNQNNRVKFYLMKNILLAFALLVFDFVQSQILDPVKGNTSVEKLSDTEYVLISKAKI